MKLFLLPALLLAFPFWLVAQTPDSLKTKPARPAQTPDNITRTNELESYMNSGQMMGRSINTVVVQVDNRYEGLKGTPYFLPDWCAGEVELNGGIKYKNPLLKFDAARQNLLVKDLRTGDSVIVDARQVVRFVLYQRDAAQRDAAQRDAAQTANDQENATAQTRNAWLFKRYTDLKTSDKDLGSGYFLVLYDGKMTLLKQVKKTFRKADYKDPYSNNVRYDSYDDDATYYLLRADRQLTRIKRSKKAVFDALADQKTALTTFADEQKLSGKTDDDLVKLIQFYDGLD